MASSSPSAKAACATCGNKGTGKFRCEGCLQLFCRTHLNEHHDDLGHQLEEIIIEYDSLKQDIDEKQNKQSGEHPISRQIDQWEQDSIFKIQQIANDARRKIKELMSLPKESEELRDLAKQLQKARTNDDYVETDLRKWATVLQKLKNDVNNFSPSIFLQEDEKETLVQKIFISATTTTTTQLIENERFHESNGPVRIENNGRRVTHCGEGNKNAYVRGIGEYSWGKHSIRFIFNKSSTDFTTWFNIVSKQMPIGDEQSDCLYQIYGWASDDDVLPSELSTTMFDNSQDMIGETVYEIELTLDCDNRKISYINQRTKNRRQIDVDLDKCPFPWKVEFYLFEVGDYVQLRSD